VDGGGKERADAHDGDLDLSAAATELNTSTADAMDAIVQDSSEDTGLGTLTITAGHGPAGASRRARGPPESHVSAGESPLAPGTVTDSEPEAPAAALRRGHCARVGPGGLEVAMAGASVAMSREVDGLHLAPTDGTPDCAAQARARRE